MSYIPNCREDEYYNQKYVNRDDWNYIKGYDWCTEMAVDNFFDNIDIGYLHGHLEHVLNEEIPEETHDEYEIEFDSTEKKVEKRVIKTYGDLLRKIMLDWIENERDELITSMIDNMDEEEYRIIKEKVDNAEKEKSAETEN